MISLKDKFVRDPGLLASEVDGDLVMLSIESGKYFGLNPVAKQIWNILEKPTKLSELCVHLIAQYNIEPMQCEREVLQFMERMNEQKLVRTCI